MSRILLVAICLATAALCGCSNLVARKVPLACRFTKQDYKVEGFRYYLSRPHLVVSREVSVLKTLEYGVLVRAKDSPPNIWEGFPYAVRVWDGCNRQLEYRDMAGRLVDANGVMIDDVATSEEPAATPEPMPATDSAPSSAASLPSPDTSGLLETLPSPDTNLLFSGTTPSDPVKEDKPAPIDAFQIAYLPDFEEQMAVKQHNFLAKSTFKLQFLDGWQLKSVETTGDSTDVPIKILQTLGSAITAAGDVEDARIKARGANQPNSETSRKEDTDLRAQRVLITHNFYIEPGMYRLTKESERSGGPHDSSWGILADMGVPVLEDTKVQLLQEKMKVVAETLEEKKCAAPMMAPMPPPGDDIPGAVPSPASVRPAFQLRRQ